MIHVQARNGYVLNSVEWKTIVYFCNRTDVTAAMVVVAPSPSLQPGPGAPCDKSNGEL
jgi:hypothetical protein